MLPTASEFIVHAVLDGNLRDQYVIVQRTNGIISAQAPVTGAQVTITAPDGRELIADEVRDSAAIFAARSYQPRVTTVYRISLDKYGVALVPGGTYRLRVRIPADKAEIMGSTVMPAILPAPPNSPVPVVFTRSRDTLSLSWKEVAHAQGYVVTFSSPAETEVVFADSSLTLAGTARVFRIGMNSVVVSAVDVNYYDYFRRSSDVFSGSGLINHLEGGTGVFGSISRLSTMTLDVRQ